MRIDTGTFNRLRATEPAQSGKRLFEAVKVAPLPQVVLRVDQRGRVVDFEAALVGDSFATAAFRRGWSAHRCLHPTCDRADCKLLHCLATALAEIDRTRILEWELPDAPAGRVARLHLRRAGLDARTFATLTVTDITASRRETGSLREANKAMSELIDRTESVQARQIKRLDRKLRNLSGELIIAQENERRRIAAELHDGLGQWLSMAKLCLESGLSKLADERATTDLNKAFSHLKVAIAEVRSIARNLRPSMLEEFGLTPTLELLCHELQLSQPAVEVDCRIEGDATEIAQPQCVAMVRILQEALNNVAKHSGATRLDVHVAFLSDQTSMRVTDNGAGMPVGPDSAARVTGIGMKSMRERAMQSGGQFRVASRPGAGTSLTVFWLHPLGSDPNQESGTYKTIGDGIGGDRGGASQV